MGSCCEHDCVVEALQVRQRSTLIKVLWINAGMFILIAAAAFYGDSIALLSDSLDNLGDALTYGLSLYAVTKGPATKARVALFKGGLIFAAASLVVLQIVYRLINPVLPSYEIMTIFSMAGLGANGLCVFLLWRHRHEDINMRSVFECSRNDIIANLSVILAAICVWLFSSGWPDLLIAILLAGYLLNSSTRVMRDAWSELAKQ